jgi:hypothetical protein
MKNWWLPLFLAASFTGQGQTSLHLTNWTFTNLQGRVYSNTTLRMATPTNISVAWEPYGYARIDFTNLPDEVRQMFQYDPDKVAALKAKEEAARKANAETASARRGTSLASTNPVDIFLARHVNLDSRSINSALTVEKKMDWRPTRTNRWDPDDLSYTLVLTIDPIGFEFTSYKSWMDMTKDKYEDQWKFELQGKMKFKHGQEIIANEAFSKFLDWQAIAAKSKTETFEKPLARYPESGSSLIRTFTFQWRSDEMYYMDRSVDARASLWASTDVKDENPDLTRPFEDSTKHFGLEMDAIDYRLKFFGFFNIVEITNFQELMKFIPDLKQELAEKLKRQDEQINLFK